MRDRWVQAVMARGSVGAVAVGPLPTEVVVLVGWPPVVPAGGPLPTEAVVLAGAAVLAGTVVLARGPLPTEAVVLAGGPPPMEAVVVMVEQLPPEAVVIAAGLVVIAVGVGVIAVGVVGAGAVEEEVVEEAAVEEADSHGRIRGIDMDVCTTALPQIQPTGWRGVTTMSLGSAK